jgi:hypothetical protein
LLLLSLSSLSSVITGSMSTTTKSSSFGLG